MKSRIIDPGKPVSELVAQYPEIKAIMADLGFKDIVKPMALSTVGKIMTLQRGAALKAVAGIPGHPVSVFVAENERIAAMVEAARQALAGDALDPLEMAAQAEALRPVALHYARKGDLLYPLLSRTYGFSGPSDVMWGVDDEIRDELKLLATAGEDLPDFGGRLSRVVTRAREMVYKENNILYPLCLQQFSQADWMRIYYELPAYDTLLTAGYPVWEAAEAQRNVLWKTGGQPAGPSEEHWEEGTLDKTVQSPDNTAHSLDKTVQLTDKTAQPLDKTVQSSAKTAQPVDKTVQSSAKTVQRPIPLGSGSLTPEQMEGVLNTIPMELSFVDEDDINRFFNEGDKLFKRPDMAIGRDVYACHPPRYEAMVRQIIGDFRAGTRDHVNVWMDKGGEPVLVRYMAVKNNDGAYIGTLECVQKMKFAEEHFLNPL